MTSDNVEGDDVALRVVDLSKTFVGTQALDRVSFAVRSGDIHALVGGNGSGKSTLIKILAGVHRGDPGGRVEVGSRTIPSDRTDTAVARAAGLHFVHQNPAVFSSLTVAENMTIGRGFETRAGMAIRWRAVRHRTREVLERFEIPAGPDTPMAGLRPADRTMVAIARALQDQEGADRGVLVLDEPTSALPSHEVDVVLAALRRYARDGQTIVFVSHRLDEVLDIADKVTVLRDGRLVTTEAAAKLDEPGLIRLIAGRALDRVYPEMPPVDTETTVLEVRHLRGGPLRDVSLHLHRREVLGVAGLLGSGRTELLQTIFGARPLEGGEILRSGKVVCLPDPAAAMRAGLAYVPEDRLGDGAFPDLSVRTNLSAADVSRYWRRMRFRHRAEQADARGSLDDFLIKAPTDTVPLAGLSGGNQQKVVLARWLRLAPDILLLDEPTQAVDIEARAEIYALIRREVEAGASVLLVTSDFEELTRVSDRVVVLSQGRIVAELHSPIDPHHLTELTYATVEPAA